MKTIIKKFFFFYMPVFLFLATSMQAKKTTEAVPKTTKEKIQGNTYVLGTVMLNGNNVTGQFTGFKITFSADGSTCSIISAGKPCAATFTSSVTIGESSIFFGTPICNTRGVASNVNVASDGATLEFVLNHAFSELSVTPVGGRTSGGAADYKYSLVKQ